jgi:hypothetical protein
MSDKHTGKGAASDSSDILRDGRTGGDSKTSAGSALSQADQHSHKTTGNQAASAASDVLRDDNTGDKSKTAAGSALSQKEWEGKS